MKKLSVREVLAVSTILIVLAAVMVPAFTDSLEQLQQKTCFGNLGVLARAMLLYVNDNNSRFPNYDDCVGSWHKDLRGQEIVGWVGYDGNAPAWPGGFNYSNPCHPWGWRVNPSKGSLWPYTDGNDKTYMCPSDTWAVSPRATTFRRGFGLSYQVNNNIFSPDYGDTSSHHWIDDSLGHHVGEMPALLSDIVTPSSTVLLGENWENRYVNWIHATQCPPFDGILRWWSCASTLRHLGGGNYAMCDGSVRWVQAADYRSLIFYRDGRQSPYWSGPDIPSNP